jgi:hypothetical protein
MQDPDLPVPLYNLRHIDLSRIVPIHQHTGHSKQGII